MTLLNKINKELAFEVDFINTYDKLLFSNLVKNGQHPEVLMITCCDSRIDPIKLMGAELGELFIIKNVANIVPPYETNDGYHGTSAALEFAVCNLKVKHIIILGHSCCGGIQSMFDEKSEELPSSSFITKWMNIARPCKNLVSELYQNKTINEQIELCSQYSLLNSKENVLSFNFINKAISNHNLMIHTWYFEFASGSIFNITQDGIAYT